MQLSLRGARALGAALALTSAVALGEDALQVVVVPSGPSAAALRSTEASLSAIPQLRELLRGSRWRVVSMEVVPGTTKFRALVFDYTHAQTLEVVGEIGAAPKGAAVRPIPEQPVPSFEEFQEAVRTLKAKPQWAEKLRSTTYALTAPMPPRFESVEGARVVNVGIRPAKGGPAQIVGVDLVSGNVVTYPGGVPPDSLAASAAATCGPADAGQATTPRGTAGQADVTISRGTTTLWQMTVIRPAASSGTNASGIEFDNVRYRGKTVLARAHTPILNVHYVNDTCGPYRDWMWQENQFTASGTTVAPGILNASSMPTTIFDTGNDAGNFAGVAYYVGTSSVVFTTELQAGWYRYSPTWTFDDTGAIHARIGFSAVTNSCTCNIHLHNAYFRLDFDVDGAANTSISRRTQGGWSLVPTETWGRRDRLGSTAFQVKNPSTGDTYQVNGGPYDYVADAYGVGDWWILKSKGTAELDDGETCTSCATTNIHINGYVNGESVQNTGVVLWYGGHFLHNINDGYTVNEVVGPDLVPVSW